MSSRSAIKANFQTGDTPTQANFEDLIDSLAHVSEDGLATTSALTSGLAGKASSSHTHAIADVGVVQSEVASFVARVLAASGTIDAATVMALDRFVVRGKAAGWWSKLDEVWPFVGGQLAAARQKLKYHASSTSSLTNSNLTEADYSQPYGITSATNGNYLATGYDPSVAGRTVNDLSCVGVLLGAATQSTGGYAVGSMNTTTDNDTPIRIDNPCGLWSAMAGVDYLYPKVIGASYTTGDVHNMYQNGIGVYPAVSQTHSGTIDGEINIFRCRRFNSIYYHNAPVGFVAFGGYLTPTEHRDLQRAILDLQIAVGRELFAKFKSSTVFLGDSITASQGADSTLKGYVHQVARKLSSQPVVACGSPTLNSTHIAASEVENGFFSGAVIVVGTNDINSDGDTNGNATLIAAYQATLEGWLAALRKQGKPALVCSPTYRKVATSNSTKCRAYATAAKAAADTHDYPFLDLDQIFRDDADPDNNLMQDGPHPKQAGHDLMARALVAAMNGVYLRSVTIDFGSISSNSSATSAVTWLTADVGDSVSVNARSLEPGLSVSAYVSADNEVTVRVTNGTGGSINPASQVFDLTLVK